MLKCFLLLFTTGISIFASGQIPVRDEPRHHNVFENDVVRILDVHLGPGDTTLYHVHNTPSVFIIFTNVIVSSQLFGGQPQKGASVTGIISYDSMTTARIHRVWNEDSSWFHVMDIELTGTKHEKNIPVLKSSILKPLFNEQQVNGYSVDLKTGKLLQLPASSRGYLIVSQTRSEINYEIAGITEHRILKPSHYIWVEAGRSFSLNANSDAKLVLLQLK